MEEFQIGLMMLLMSSIHTLESLVSSKLSPSLSPPPQYTFHLWSVLIIYINKCPWKCETGSVHRVPLIHLELFGLDFECDSSNIYSFITL